jgi:hypothetical protein
VRAFGASSTGQTGGVSGDHSSVDLLSADDLSALLKGQIDRLAVTTSGDTDRDSPMRRMDVAAALPHVAGVLDDQLATGPAGMAVGPERKA